jgi:D-alanyl-D-alanine carboxypeptidase/D-alanyl-D-alanine-endopeptidase (penicillin-binding protein 4)
VGDVPTATTSPWSLRKKAVVAVAIVSALAVALGASFAAGYALASPSPEGGDRDIVVLEENAEVLSVIRAQPTLGSQPVRIRTCSLDSLASDPVLATFAGIVLDPQSGEVLFSRNDDVGVAPASVLKLVTAAAAVTTLGPDTRFETRVVGSTEPGVVVLVGGGDATLSTLPPGSESVYKGAPRIADLAEQTVAALGATLPEGERVTITEVVVDLSLWDTKGQWEPSWSPNARAMGFISQVTPLQVDGDRQNPAATVSRRSDNAPDRAARAFVDALRAAGNTARFVNVSYGTADPGAPVLAAVQSQPVSALANYMVKESDNTLAEMLARHVSLAVGLGGTAESLNQAIAGTLASRGLPLEEISLQDGSGLSNLNRVEPRYVARLLTEIYRSEGTLRSVREGLPVAGADGSLRDRFTGANASAAGRVFAKTGSIQGVRSLAGFVNAADGTDLAFAFFSMGEVGDPTRAAVEAVVTGVYSCGENLANF